MLLSPSSPRLNETNSSPGSGHCSLLWTCPSLPPATHPHLMALRFPTLQTVGRITFYTLCSLIYPLYLDNHWSDGLVSTTVSQIHTGGRGGSKNFPRVTQFLSQDSSVYLPSQGSVEASEGNQSTVKMTKPKPRQDTCPGSRPQPATAQLRLKSTAPDPSPLALERMMVGANDSTSTDSWGS